MTQWYAIRTATNRERQALAALDEQGFATFLPCETMHRRLGRAMEVVHRPLFPGYMFTLCDETDFRRVLETEGVSQFVSVQCGDVIRPMAIPLAAIIEIQAEERAGTYDRTRLKRIAYEPRKNDRVKVTSGAWMGFIAKVLATPRGKRVHVMIEGPFGRGLTLDVARMSAA